MSPFTVGDLLQLTAQRRPHHPALVHGEVSMTYAELARAARGLSAWLESQGVKRGDRVGIHLPKGIREVVATFAVAQAGGVFVNINYQWTTSQLEYVCNDCDIRVLITDARKISRLKQSPLENRLDAVLSDAQVDDARVVDWSDVPEDCDISDVKCVDVDVAALLYTSGSTGMPKGVVLTHQNIVAGAQVVTQYLRNTSDDRVLGLLPMSFDYGLNQVTSMFMLGGTVVLQSVVIPDEIVRTLQEKNVTGMAAVPPTWIQVVRYLVEAPRDLPHLRYITNSGGKIPDTILRQLPSVFPDVDIVLMYGLTEAFRSSYLPPRLFHEKLGAIGISVPNNELFVIDSTKGVCGPGEEGELVHRGSLISQGYWNNPEATAEKIRPCKFLKHLKEGEEVLYSGDLVRIDEDGILWFVGRLDNMIKCSGFRLSPTEVEEVIHKHRAITEVIAFGVEDDEVGQVVHVAVSAADGTEIDRKEISKFCRERMPNYMVPRAIHVFDRPMPRTASGKIDRPAVIRTVTAGS